jgi:hypothetical protein
MVHAEPRRELARVRGELFTVKLTKFVKGD